MVAQKNYEKKQRPTSKVKQKSNKLKSKTVCRNKPIKLSLRDVNRSVIYTKKKVDPKAKWIIFELAEEVTFEDCSEAIEQDILQLLGEDVQYFIPIYSKDISGNLVSDILFEGYFFIKSSNKILDSIDDIRSDHIKGAMKKNSKIVQIPGEKINEFKKEMYEKLLRLAPKRKQWISPKIGIFSNLKGEVLSVNKRDMTFIARFKCSTREVEAPVNFINYIPISQNEVL